MVEFCFAKGLRVDNKYFEHRSLHKYTRGQEGVEVEGIIELVSKKNMLRYMHYVRAVKEWYKACQITILCNEQEEKGSEWS